MGSAFKILSFSLSPVFWVNEKISFQYPFLLPSCRKNTSVKITWKAHLCHHLSSLTFLHWISSVPHQGPATSDSVRAVDLLCPPVIMSYEILLVFSYHICAFALIPWNVPSELVNCKATTFFLYKPPFFLFFYVGILVFSLQCLQEI